MRNVLIRIAVSLTVAGVTMGVAHTPAHAGFVDGNKLYEVCSVTDMSSSKFTYCIGFITGVFDSSALLDRCVPDNAGIGPVRDVIKQYLLSHPEERHFAASAIVTEAVQRAFCK